MQITKQKKVTKLICSGIVSGICSVVGGYYEIKNFSDFVFLTARTELTNEMTNQVSFTIKNFYSVKNTKEKKNETQEKILLRDRDKTRYEYNRAKFIQYFLLFSKGRVNKKIFKKVWNFPYLDFFFTLP